MNQNDLNLVRAPELETIPLALTLTIASGVVTSNSYTGVGSKNTTGQYKLTLKDRYVRLLSASLTLESSAAVDVQAIIKSVDVSNTGIVLITLHTDGTPVDLTNCKIHVLLMLKNSTV